MTIRLRAVALASLTAGAAGSLLLLMRASQHSPLVLKVLFFGWVLLPFVALALADRAARGWSGMTRTTLHVVMLVVALGSLAEYSGMVPVPRWPKVAATYLMVPLASWLLAALAIATASLVSRRRT